MSWCRRCGRQIDWGRTASGEVLPLDPGPAADGTLLVLPNGRLREVPEEKRAQCPAPLFRDHRSSCAANARAAR